MRELRRAALAALLFLSSASSLFAPRAARASVFDSLPEILSSHQMPRAPGDVGQEKPRQVLLNGYPLNVATGRTGLRVKEVLDYYQERYPGGVLRDMVGKPVAVRREDETAGNMMIVDIAERARAQEVMDGKRPLSSAGPLRLVYARRVGLATEYLLAWSERPLPLGVLQSEASVDAPGEDLKDIPRPPGSQRSMTFAEPKAGYRMAMYSATNSPEEALRLASQTLRQAGWTGDEAFERVANKKGRLVARFSREGRDVVVTARQSRDERRQTQVTYLAREL